MDGTMAYAKPRTPDAPAANHREHTAILMQRVKKKFEVPNMGDMTCCRVRFSCNGRKRAESRAGDSRSIVADVSTSETCGADECPEIAARDCDRFFRDAENRLL